MDGNIRILVSAGDRCGEGIIWAEAENALYWTDVSRFLIHRFNLATRAYYEWRFDQPVVALSLTSRPDTLLVSLGSRIILWNPATDLRVDLGFGLREWPDTRLNDGRTDPIGNFWVGSMVNNVNADGSVTASEASEPANGRLYRVNGAGAVSVCREKIGIPNTLCWSPDCRHFYFGDSLANTIYRYDFNPESGEIANESVFLQGFGRGCPDGSAMDSEGFLWNCRFGGGCVVRVAPDGNVERVIEMPTRNPTSCAFGGDRLQRLFITSAEIFTDPGDLFAGSLFEFDAGVSGMFQGRFEVV